MSPRASTPMTEVRKLDDFAGNWNLTRRIVPKDGPVAQFEGTASWSWKERGLSYLEHGVMTLSGHLPMQAERRYFWKDDLSVYFDDGRFFHAVPATGGETRHWCDPDTYTGTYDFAAWPDFTLVWHVTGPRKDYRSTTIYTRL